MMGVFGHPYVMEPLLKDTLNKGHDTFNLSIKTSSVVPTGPWQYNFTRTTSVILYNSTIAPKLASPKCFSQCGMVMYM